MSTMTTDAEGMKKLGSLIKDIKFAMLTTVDEDGTLRSRPMATQDAEFNGELWFFTRASTPKVEEVQREHQVNLSYAAPNENRYVSISGYAQIVHDRAKNNELWNPLLKAWFPNGPDDPQTALLKVTVEKAEYWDSPSSAMVHLIGVVKAAATGKAYQPGPGENEKLTFHEGGGMSS